MSIRDQDTLMDVEEPSSAATDGLTPEQKEEYRRRLAEKLKDPEFRKIEGFPIGTDEAILALSDPPYYTACPNPFLEEWLAEHAKPYDPETDDYHREPFAEDVSEGKSDPVYDAHTYHTKVPHKTIANYIAHYTAESDLVMDGFCGSGSLAVAAQQLRRNAILCDLSPLATFISSNFVANVRSTWIEDTFNKLLDRAEERLGHLYQTRTEAGEIKQVHYAVWSDCFICPACSSEIIYWDAAIDIDKGIERDQFSCPFCRTTLKKRSLQRQFQTRYDPLVDGLTKLGKRHLVRVVYKRGRSSQP